jgi:hypothetical protein
MIAYGIFRMPAVQRWLTGKIANYLSEKLHTKVELKGLDISIFDHFILEKLYIEDQQKDTLLYIDYLGINIKSIRIRKSIFAFDKFRLKELVFNLKYDTAGVMNLQFVLDAFSSNEPPDTTASAPMTFKVDKIQIENSRFSYFVADTSQNKTDSSKVSSAMNFNDLKISNFNLNAKNLIVAGTSIMMDIDSVKLQDKCGFRLLDLSSNIYYGDNRIDLSKFKLITDNSKFYFEKLKLTYPSLDAFDDFEHKVNFNIRVADSTSIGLKDAGYFVSELKGFDQQVGMEAIVNGTLSELDVSKLDVWFGQNTRLTTNFTINGLPDIEKANFNIKVDTLTSSIYDINSLKDPSNPSKSMVALPTSLASVGKIYYKGNINGNLAKIVTKGKLITGIGTIDSKINIEQKQNGYTNIYGNLIGKDLAISDIIDSKDLGKFDITDTLDFKISPKGDIEGVSNGRVNNLQLFGYKYQTLTFDAIVNKYVYQAELKISDPNLQLMFDGMFVTNDEEPKVKFTANLDKFIPYKLHLYEDSLFSTKLKLNGSVIGLDPDVLTGKFTCDIESLTNEYGKFRNKKLLIRSDYDKIDSVRTMEISSDFLDVRLWGDIKPTTLAGSFEKYLYTLMPSLSDTLKTPIIANKDSLYRAITAENNFDFELKIKDLTEVRKMFFPGIDIKRGTKLSGKFNLMPGKFALDAYCPEANIEGTKIEEFILNGDNRDEKLNFYVNTNKIFLTETNSVDNSLINAYIYKDNFYVDLVWNTFLDSLNYSGDVSLILGLENRPNRPSLLKLRLDSSNLSFQNSYWTINSNEIKIDSNFVDLGNIICKSKDDEKLYIGGKISESDKDTLKVEIVKLKLGLIDQFIKSMGLGLTGELNGSTYITGVMGDLMVKSVDSISNLQLSGIKVGDVRINALWDNKNSIADLYAETQLINTKNFILKGKYLVDKDYLDFDVNIERLPFEIAEPFVKGIISQIEGKISGKVSIKGKSDNPEIKAGLKFIRAGFLVDEIQTYYSFTDSVFIDNNSIRLKKMQLNAGRNSYAYLEGSISHKNFDDIKIDMSLDAHNFLFLKTVETDTTSFYGTVFASGGIGLKGDIDNMDINIKLKTEKGTKFYLPLSSSSEVSESNFISFLSRDTTITKKKDETTADLSGFNINFELEATSDAEMQMIMDETVGDVIKVRGMGNLDIKVNAVGDISLYGTYTVTKGDYLFTLQNLVNKRFVVDPGSTIRWNGDPYNAIMDMTAVYKIRKVPLYDLMQDPNYKEMKTNVECNLSMSGGMMAPQIGFGLKLPEAKEPVISNINGLAQDDLNQQILSLLILGKFQPLPSVQSTADAAGGNAISNNAIEMLSNQLSNWLSKISDDVDIGVNYKQGGEMTSNELELALSTQLFNDRVSINANAGVSGGSPGQASQGEANSANKIVGDVEIEVKLNKKGTLRSKVFNRTNQKIENSTEQGLYTQGIGVFYRKEFNTGGELLRDFWKTITLQKRKEKIRSKNQQQQDINRKEEEKEKPEKPEEPDDSKQTDQPNKDIKKEDDNGTTGD